MISLERPVDFRPWFEVASCLCEYDGKILLLKRLEGKSEGGKWGAPGGKIDVGESVSQAVLREVQEETGIVMEEARIELAHTFFVRTDNNKDIVYHLHRSSFDQLPDVVLSPLEHTEYRWVSVDEAFVLPLVHDMEECLKCVYE